MTLALISIGFSVFAIVAAGFAVYAAWRAERLNAPYPGPWNPSDFKLRDGDGKWIRMPWE